jgi:hypothetical protein
MGNPPPNLKPYPSYPSGVQARSIKQRVELLILRAFQARASKFLPNLPQLDDTLEWFALMRHWGLPNRLLDVTTSPYVGLYFALKETLQPKERTNQAAAVWVINHVRLRGSGALQAGYDVHANLSDPALYHKHFVGAKRRPLVAPVHPRTHNERLAAQQGTFLCYADIESSLEGNIDPSFFQKDVYPPPEPEYPPISFLKLRIDPAAAVGILARLSAMNIHQASLFPDLSGYITRNSSKTTSCCSEPIGNRRGATLISKAWSAWAGLVEHGRRSISMPQHVSLQRTFPVRGLRSLSPDDCVRL